ncbi:MAG: transcriptional repressor [Saprospiraceae bacterium]|nr:transcriptional repressor [Saprospiraceae bacterium]
MMNEKIENKLNKRHIKPTAMRILVLQYLMEQDKAVSLQSIENAFEAADKSTLYRTLKTFEKNKLVHTIDDGTKQLKYALCLESCQCETNDLHYHFHCTTCENTFCLTNQNIPHIELPKNFKMQQANMVIKGHCGDCNR